MATPTPTSSGQLESPWNEEEDATPGQEPALRATGTGDTELLHPTLCWSTAQSTFPTGTHHFSIRATLCSSQLLPSFKITNSVTFSHQVALASRTQADTSLCFIWISNSLERHLCSQSPVVFSTVETLTGQGEEVIPLQPNQ